MRPLIVFPSSVIICWFYDCFCRIRRRKVLLLLLHFVCIWNVQMCERPLLRPMLLCPRPFPSYCSLDGSLPQSTRHFLPGLRQLKARWQSQGRRMAWIRLPGPLNIIWENRFSSFEKSVTTYKWGETWSCEEKKWATWKQSLFSNGIARMALFLLKCIQI